MLLREDYVGQHVGLSHEVGEPDHLRAQLISDGTPLGAGVLAILQYEGCAGEGQDEALTLVPCICHRIAYEVHAAALPTGMQHLGDGDY